MSLLHNALAACGTLWWNRPAVVGVIRCCVVMCFGGEALERGVGIFEYSQNVA